MLNYNWQIWNTAAYSIYAGTTDVISKTSAHKDGLIFFAHSKALIMEKTASFQIV